MLGLLRSLLNEHCVHLSDSFQQYIAWFNVFLDRFNGKTMIHDQGCPHIHVSMDASLSGVRAIWNDNVYAATYPPRFTDNLSIVHLELINICVILHVWGKQWNNKLVKIWCDNAAVVHILTSGKTRDDILALYARSIWLLTASNDIQTQYSHVVGVNNVYADRLSRWFFQNLLKQILHTFYKAKHGIRLFIVISFQIIIYNFRESIGLTLVISRRALAREGDYEMMSVCACVR